MAFSESRKGIAPSLSELFRLHKDDVFIHLNCHAIAKVESFNPEKQTCTAKISYQRTFFTRDLKGDEVVEYRDYPLLIDIPVVVIRGGAAGLTMPIKEGDDCLILFNDRDIDNWFNGQNTGGVASPRLHSMSDGIALVGLSSLSTKIESYEAEKVVLFNDQAKFTIGQKFSMKNDAQDLKLILTELVNVIIGLATNPTVPGNPATLNPATIVLLNQVVAKIEGLLE